jgi:hypothetical protein
MLAAARRAWERGIGVVAMKVMGCGAFADDPGAAISYAARLSYVHSLCIGMRNLQEVEENVCWLSLADAARAADRHAAGADGYAADNGCTAALHHIVGPGS